MSATDRMMYGSLGHVLPTSSKQDLSARAKLLIRELSMLQSFRFTL
jgi:hypothetical protein